MSLNRKLLGVMVSAVNAAAIENDATPFLPGAAVVISMYATLGAASGTFKIQGSPDNVTFTDLLSMVTTTGGMSRAEVVCPRYLRTSCTAFVSGSVTADVNSA